MKKQLFFLLISRRIVPAALLAVVIVSASGNSREPSRGDSGLTVHRLAIRGKAWALEVALPNSFSVRAREVSEDGESVRLFADEDKSGMAVSVFLEKNPGGGDALAARDYYTNKGAASPIPQEDIKQYEIGDLAVREYMVREFLGEKIEQKNMNCFLSHDGYWADVHISRALYRPSDKEYFDAIQQNIKIGPIDPTTQIEKSGTEPYSFAVPQHGSLILPIQASWISAVEKSPKRLPPTLVLRPGKGEAFELMITPLWSPTNDVNFNRPDNLKKYINAGLSQMLPSAVEKDVAIQEFSAVDGPGYYFIVTDKAPGPGEFPLAMFATVGVGDLLLSVTLLFRDKESAEMTSTLKMLQGIRQEKKD